jgi:hypothetical protein
LEARADYLAQCHHLRDWEHQEHPVDVDLA